MTNQPSIVFRSLSMILSVRIMFSTMVKIKLKLMARAFKPSLNSDFVNIEQFEIISKHTELIAPI